LCALLVACTSNVGTPSARGPVALEMSAALPGFRAIWVNTDLRPIAQPIAVGSELVGLVVDGSWLAVVSIDPATGGVRWRQRASPAHVTPGVTIELVPVGDDKVAYFRPYDGGGMSQLVVADARTGRDLTSSPPYWFYSIPYVCENGKDVCVISQGNGAGRSREYRLDVAKDEYGPNSDGLPLGTRLLDVPGLLDLADRPDNTLGWLRDGKLQWRTPINAAFSRRFSSDHGWTWQRFADQQVLVGTVFGEPQVDGERRISDLSLDSATAGLSELTGRVLWRDLGSSVQCGLRNQQRLPVRCRLRGTMTSQGAAATVFEGLQVTVEGFAPVTGETTWTVPLGAEGGLIDSRLPIPLAGPTQVVVNGPDGPVVLDYASGTVSTPPPGATYWCLITASYESFPSWTYDGVRRYDRIGGQIAAVCDERGRSSTALPGPQSTMAAGTRIGDHVVIAARNGYVGFKIR
jgi:hypothetical protein